MRALWLLGWLLAVLVSACVFVFALFGIWLRSEQWFETSEVLMIPAVVGVFCMCWWTTMSGVPEKSVGRR